MDSFFPGRRSLFKIQMMDGFYELYEQLALTFGTASLWALVALEMSLFAVALYLTLFVKSQHALTLFLPLTLSPIFVGALNTFLTLSSTITFLESREASESQLQETMIVVSMSAMPLLFSFVLSIPACFAVAMGRVWIMWDANRKPKAPKEVKLNADQLRKRTAEVNAMDADNYVAELVKSRR